MRHLDLFSGIGGFALAAQAAGCTTIGFSEIEPYACKVLKKHWPDIPNYGDITRMRGVECDLITGGFPCQPYSVAGKQRGSEDHRALWPEALRLVAESRPSWFLGENVAGIISMELDRVLSDLEAIGYTARPVVIPACAVGSFQHRERIWIIAHAKRKGLPGREQIQCVPISESAAHTKPSNGMVESWKSLARLAGGLRASDGLSCVMVQREVKCYGNAIVPRVAEIIISYMMQVNQQCAT